MERLLARGDYFKHTTRSYLSEAEKHEIVEAVGRASRFLGEQASSQRIEESSPSGSASAILRGISAFFAYGGRWVTLVKGSTQPRYLYRHRRRWQVEIEARRIAEETGADFDEIRAVFLRRMSDYIDPSI